MFQWGSRASASAWQFVSTIFLESMGGILLAWIHQWDKAKGWLGFGDFGPIFKVTDSLKLLILLHWQFLVCTISPEPMVRISPNLHGYIIETSLKAWLDFSDLDLIFKVTGGLKYVNISLKLMYLLNRCLDSNQTSTAIPLGQFKELTVFWWPWPYFQGH